MKFLSKKDSSKEINIIASNLAMLYGEGMSITSSIYILKDFPLSKRYKKSLNFIYEDILEGSSLCDAFSKFSELYPDFFIEMVRSGEETGNLSKILLEVGDYYWEMDRLKKDIIGACIYPTFLMITMFIIINVFVFVVIPNFSDMLTNNQGLPAHTKLILEASLYLKENFIKVSLLIVLWGVAIPVIFLKEYIRKYFKIAISKNNFVKSIIEYKLIITLNMILSSGINLSKGLMICTNSNNDKNLNVINDYITKGISLSDAAIHCKELSEYSLAMIKIGESSGTLEESLKKTTKILKDRNAVFIDKLGKLIQPLAIIIMAILVLLFLVSFILPLFDSMYNVG
ncbi:type II secretion system F family protein [Clostridium chrysemydis]|uniref:type II secretion system F family protein n=1 Tax=Clostridium chrysemydis TaxID=2665504 RepID=UPI0018833CF7|nr:type II secretion system F family protein [Clostridium chrysemydis]